MAAAPTGTPARPWDPEFKHSDRERWICIYPAYVNVKKTVAQGRRVPKTIAVDNPLYSEIRDVCASAGMVVGVENKVYSREVEPRDMKFRGRIRIQLKNDDGTPLLPDFHNRQSVLNYLCATIPKLKGRTSGAGASGGQQQQAAGGGGGGKKKKGRR